MDSHIKVLKIFSPLKILNSTFQKRETFGAFLPFSLFFYASFSLFFLCSISLLRMNSGIFEMFEEKTIFSNFLSNGMDLCMPRFFLG
jgi:hypothetical protein